VPSNALEGSTNSHRRDSEGDVVFYIEEPKAGIVVVYLSAKMLRASLRKQAHHERTGAKCLPQSIHDYEKQS
jgi:hypothetical protein